MRIIDISPAVTTTSLVWPGDTPFHLEPQWSIASGDAVTVSTITSTTHVGAHIDAPSHVRANSATITETALEHCMGECAVVDVSDLVDRSITPHGAVTLQRLLPRLAEVTTQPVARLLLRHYAQTLEEWDQHMPGIHPEVMRWFSRQGGVLMGVDLASFDVQDSKDLTTHHIAVDSGVVLLEGLDLTQVVPGFYELIALPMPWVGADASPVRAVLREHSTHPNQNGS